MANYCANSIVFFSKDRSKLARLLRKVYAAYESSGPGFWNLLILHGYTNRQIDDQFPKEGGTAFKPEYMRQVEIEGHFEDYKESIKEGGNKFVIDREFRTLHSPDVEFDPQLSLVDFLNVEYIKVKI